MSTIYLVTSGEYSAYMVDGVFSTESKAKEYMARFGGADAFNPVAEESLDPEIPGPDVQMWRVIMTKDGEQNLTVDLGMQVLTRPTFEPEIAIAGVSFPPELCGKWVVMFDNIKAETKQHALKIANERRLTMKAEGKL